MTISRSSIGVGYYDTASSLRDNDDCLLLSLLLGLFLVSWCQAQPLHPVHSVLVEHHEAHHHRKVPQTVLEHDTRVLLSPLSPEFPCCTDADEVGDETCEGECPCCKAG